MPLGFASSSCGHCGQQPNQAEQDRIIANELDRAHLSCWEVALRSPKSQSKFGEFLIGVPVLVPLFGGSCCFGSILGALS